MWSHRGPYGAEIASQACPPYRHARKRAATAAWLLLCALSLPARAQEPLAEAPYETVVVASLPPPERARRDDAASSSAVTSDRTPRSAEDLPQVLSELPGVAVTRLGGLGAMATLSLRGSAANQVEVYFDGVPLSAANGGGVDIGMIPIVDLDRIEVYRGMSPISFGPTAMGGVVSLESAVPDSTGGRAYVGGGSFGTTFGGAQVRRAGSRLQVSASANYLGSKGDFPYRNDQGLALNSSNQDVLSTRQNNALSQLDGICRARWLLPGRRELSGTLALFGRNQGVAPNGSYPTDVSYVASLSTRRLLATAAYESREDLGPGGRLRLQLYTVDTWQRFDDPDHEVAAISARTRDLTASHGLLVTAARPLAGWLRLSTVVDGHVERFEPSRESADPTSGTVGPQAQSPGDRIAGAGAVEARAVWSRLRLDVIPSARLEWARDSITNPSQYLELRGGSGPATYLLPNARLALLQYPTSQFVLRANLGYYGRLPSTYERYGDTGRVLGRPDLRPETSTNADLGAGWSRTGESYAAALDAALFASWAHDLIFFELLGNTMRPSNASRARTLGTEVWGSFAWRRVVRAVGQATFTDARNLEDSSDSNGKQMPLRPRLRAYARPELRELPLAGRWRWGLYFDVDVTSGNYSDRPNLNAIPARTLFGAGGQVEAPHLGLRLIASATNLADTSAVDLIGYPLPGRSFFLTMQWSSPTPKETIQ